METTKETVRCYNESERIVGEVDVEVKRVGNKVWSAHVVAFRQHDDGYELPKRFDWYDQQNVGEVGYEGSQAEWAAKPLSHFSPGERRCIV